MILKEYISILKIFKLNKIVYAKNKNLQVPKRSMPFAGYFLALNFKCKRKLQVATENTELHSPHGAASFRSAAQTSAAQRRGGEAWTSPLS